MKPLVLLFLLILRTQVRVTGNPTGEGSVEQGPHTPWKPGGEKKDEPSDLIVEEAHPAFSFLAIPPRFETSHHGQERNWEHSRGSSFNSNWNSSPRGYDSRPALNHAARSNVNFNYRVDPLRIKGNEYLSSFSGTPSPQLPQYNPYTHGNSYQSQHGRERHHYSQPSDYRPKSQFEGSDGNVRLYNEHYGPDIATHSVHEGQLIYKEHQSHLEPGHEPYHNPQIEQTSKPQTSEDQEDSYIGYQGTVNKQSSSTTDTEIEGFEHSSANGQLKVDANTYHTEDHLESPSESEQKGHLEGSIGSTSKEPGKDLSGTDHNHEDNSELFEDRPSALQSRNLAALLAGASTIGLKNTDAGNDKLPEINEEQKKKDAASSKTRTAVPEHIMRSEHDIGSDYYDELFDEFVEMYYDSDTTPEKKSKGFREFLQRSQKQKENSPNNRKDHKETLKGLKLITVSQPTPDTTEKVHQKPETTTNSYDPIDSFTTSSTKTDTPHDSSPKTPTTSTSRTLSTISLKSTSTTSLSKLSSSSSSSTSTTPLPTSSKRTFTTTQESSTVKQPKFESETSTTSGRSQPISLVEILKELGLSLPQFLGTLKVHGSSLKEFTANLQGKSLSKSEFRRAKGNVKTLLEILESSKDPILSREVTSTSASSTKQLPKFQLKSSTTATVKAKPKLTTSTTESTTQSTVVPDQKPRIFGSRPSAISFQNTPEGEPKNTNSDESASKIPSTVKLEEANGAGILQNFKTMFNISDLNLDGENPVSTTTLKPVREETTKRLRPYKSGAERYRPYRPLDFEGGRDSLYRGILSHRLASTSRPTLRPPYVPPPQSINFGESIKSSETEASNDKSGSKTESFQTSFRKKDIYFTDLHNHNTIKNTPESLEVSTRSAIMAAGILGGVALSVFIAIFIVVKYRNHVQRNRRRIPLTLPSDSSSSSFPPLFTPRPIYDKECYQTSGFWTSLKKKFDPYSPSSSPTSM